jgi:hypothetical protein
MNSIPISLECPEGHEWDDYDKMCETDDSLSNDEYEEFYKWLMEAFDFDWDNDDELETAVSSNDRCDLETHPDFGKGSCIEDTKCAGVYVHNWCQSKAASVKCCFENTSNFLHYFFFWFVRDLIFFRLGQHLR